MEHVRPVLDRVLRGVRARRTALAPLEPNAFLRWAWMVGPRDPGTSPLTLDDVLFELGWTMTRETLRREYVRTAARVRRNQRLGLDPFEGIS